MSDICSQSCDLAINMRGREREENLILCAVPRDYLLRDVSCMTYTNALR